MEQSKADSFTAYLKEKQRLERAKQPPPAGGTALSTLGTLAEAPGHSMTLVDLQAENGMNFVDFAEAVKRLQASGYLTLSGAPGSEIAELTRRGEEVAELARQG